MHFALLIAFSFALPVSIRECLRRHAAQGRTEAIGDIHHVSLERTEEGLFTIRSCSPALHNLLQFFFSRPFIASEIDITAISFTGRLRGLPLQFVAIAKLKIGAL